MANYKTEQEEFWAGTFGTEYILRNQGDDLLASNLNFFSKTLSQARGIENCIEFGANIGMNLRSLKLLYPRLEMHAIEINKEAVKELTSVIPEELIYNQSLLDFDADRVWDLVLIKGVLIHINPHVLSRVYEKLYHACGRYLLVLSITIQSQLRFHIEGILTDSSREILLVKLWLNIQNYNLLIMGLFTDQIPIFLRMILLGS